MPTVHHHAVASALLDAGVRPAGGEAACGERWPKPTNCSRCAEKKGRILQPGHLERFNPAVLAVQPQLRRPMFFEAHRLSVFTPRALDVDVVLDLMIHDLDIVLTFANSPVREVRAVGLPILSPKRGHRECARGVRVRLRGELYGFAGFDGAGAQAAIF